MSIYVSVILKAYIHLDTIILSIVSTILEYLKRSIINLLMKIFIFF